jgi:hypothetical protein
MWLFFDLLPTEREILGKCSVVSTASHYIVLASLVDPATQTAHGLPKKIDTSRKCTMETAKENKRRNKNVYKLTYYARFNSF